MDWLQHMLTEHGGVGTTAMRVAGISGNPSQRRAEVEARGFTISSRRRQHPNGHMEAVYTLAEPDPIAELRESPEPSMWVAPEPEPEQQVPIRLEFVMCANDGCGRIVGHPEPSRRCYCREPQEITMVLDIQPAEARAAA